MSQLKISRFVEFGKKIVAVGRNYSEHVNEMGYTKPEQKVPVIFIKPSSAYITEGNAIQFPPGCTELHHEVELGVVIGSTVTKVTEADAGRAVAGYALALDMTARDYQQLAKDNGNPWTLAKCFDTSCPIGEFVEPERIGDPNNLDLWLKVNGETRQSDNTRAMVYGVNKLISYVSTYITLERGDLLLTGTPSGVGPVQPGDIIEAGIGNLVQMRFEVAK